MSEQLAPAVDPPERTGRPSTVPAVGPAMPTLPLSVHTPDGTVHIRIATQADGSPWIDCTVGKGGTAIQACAHALAALTALAIRDSTDPEATMLRSVQYLRGVTHERSTRFGNDALSVPDALGLAIQELASGSP